MCVVGVCVEVCRTNCVRSAFGETAVEPNDDQTYLLIYPSLIDRDLTISQPGKLYAWISFRIEGPRLAV